MSLKIGKKYFLIIYKRTNFLAYISKVNKNRYYNKSIVLSLKQENVSQRYKGAKKKSP